MEEEKEERDAIKIPLLPLIALILSIIALVVAVGQIPFNVWILAIPLGAGILLVVAALCTHS